MHRTRTTRTTYKTAQHTQIESAPTPLTPGEEESGNGAGTHLRIGTGRARGRRSGASTMEQTQMAEARREARRERRGWQRVEDAQGTASGGISKRPHLSLCRIHPFHVPPVLYASPCSRIRSPPCHRLSPLVTGQVAFSGREPHSHFHPRSRAEVVGPDALSKGLEHPHG